jgi:hypothetical protein
MKKRLFANLVFLESNTLTLHEAAVLRSKNRIVRMYTLNNNLSTRV